MKTITQLIPELDRICEEHGLEKQFVAYRNMPSREHGYLKAYEIYKQRHRIKNVAKTDQTKILACVAFNNSQIRS